MIEEIDLENRTILLEKGKTLMLYPQNIIELSHLDYYSTSGHRELMEKMETSMEK